MEFFRFIKWQWAHIGRDTKQISLVIILSIAQMVFSIYMLYSFWIVVFTTFLVMIGIILFYEEVRAAWTNYKKFKGREAEEIMQRLRG